MKIVSNHWGFEMLLHHIGKPGRTYTWASEKTGKKLGQLPVDLTVVDAIDFAKKHEFVGVIFFADRLHVLKVIRYDDLNQNVILLNDIDLIDKVNRAIGSGEAFASVGDAHENLSKAGSVTA